MKSDITHWMKNTLYNKFYKTENTNHKFEFLNSERIQFIIRLKKKILEQSAFPITNIKIC